MELARRHCLNMAFTEASGRGLAELRSGLPINARRISCPVAVDNSWGRTLSGSQRTSTTGTLPAVSCAGPPAKCPTIPAVQLVEQAGVTVLLGPFRHLARHHADVAKRVLGAALASLHSSLVVEATAGASALIPDHECHLE